MHGDNCNIDDSVDAVNDHTSTNGEKTEKQKESVNVKSNTYHLHREDDDKDKTIGDEKNNHECVEKAVATMVITRQPPVQVLYCPICTFPAEMCEFSGMYEKCRP